MQKGNEQKDCSSHGESITLERKRDFKLFGMKSILLSLVMKVKFCKSMAGGLKNQNKWIINRIHILSDEKSPFVSFQIIVLNVCRSEWSICSNYLSPSCLPLLSCDNISHRKRWISVLTLKMYFVKKYNEIFCIMFVGMCGILFWDLSPSSLSWSSYKDTNLHFWWRDESHVALT